MRINLAWFGMAPQSLDVLEPASSLTSARRRAMRDGSTGLRPTDRPAIPRKLSQAAAPILPAISTTVKSRGPPAVHQSERHRVGNRGDVRAFEKQHHAE